MTMTRKVRGTTALASAGVLAALVAASLTVPATAAPVRAQATACPAPLPVSDVTAGMTGEGLTVVKGTTPEAFKVEVLGVLDDGIGAGRDMIIVNLSDYDDKHVIDQGGGPWAGISGSPVYVGDKLLGSVSYGFTAAPSSTLAGVTPAQDLYDVVNLPGNAVNAKPKVKAKASVKISASTKAKLAKLAGTAVPRGSLQEIPTPLAVSGLSPKRINKLQAGADSAGLSVRAYAAGRRSAPQEAAVPAATPVPGGNFAAMISYGDVSLGGVGTTTAVCGNQAVAFGHPFTFSGPSTYGANDANAIAIVKDDAYGAFKMSNIGADFGTVNQDRLAGIRTDLTKTPALVDLTTDITNTDTVKQRTGVTKVADQNYLSTAAILGTWANYDATFDEIGDGVATAWTITGTRAGGAKFTVTRPNRWSDQYDVSSPPTFEVADAVDALITNEFEPVTIDSVTFTSTASTKFDQLSITKLAVSVNGAKYTSAKSLRLKVGDKLKLKVTLRPYRSTTTKTSTVALTVPKAARGQSGVLSASGGSDLGGDEDFDLECYLTGECDEDEEGSLDSVIKSITDAPRNDAVVADLSVESDEGDESSVATGTKLKTRTVSGSRSIEVSVRR